MNTNYMKEGNNELEMAMDKLGYAKEDIPEEFLNETPDEEVQYVLKDGELHEE